MNELQRSYKNWEDEIKQSYPPVISEVLNNLSNGQSVSDAVDNAFIDTKYLELIENKTVQSVMASSQLGLGSKLVLDTTKAYDYYLFTNFANGVNLKSTIWDGDLQNAVKSSIQEYLKFKGNVIGLTKEIKKTATPQARLPKVLEELLSLTDKAGSKELSAKIKQARRQIEKLSSRGYAQNRVKPVYTKLVDAVENGVGQSALDKVVANAFNRKVQYLNSRVARTEMARAYGMSFYRRVEQDDGIIAVRWTLSSGHPKPDICDHFHEVNGFGWGEGIYPVSMLPPFPAHSNCLCALVSVRDDPDNPLKNGRYSQQRSIDYLASLSDKKRGQIIGVANAKDKSKWIGALKDKGFVMGKKQPMTANKVLKPIEPKVRTVKDIEQELRTKHGIKNVDLTGVDVKSAIAVSNAFDEMKSQGFTSPYETLESAKISAIADSSIDRMRLNSSLFKDNKIITERLTKASASGWSPRNATSVESLIYHEYTHGLTISDIYRKNANGGKISRLHKRYNSKLKSIEKKYKKSISDLRRLGDKDKWDSEYPAIKQNFTDEINKYKISTYGTSGAKRGSQIDEFMAEAFSDYMVNKDKARPHSIEVYKLMKELYSKKD